MASNQVIARAHRDGDVELLLAEGLPLPPKTSFLQRTADRRVLARGRVSAGAFGWTWCLDYPFKVPFRTGYSGTKTRKEALAQMVEAFIAHEA